MAPPPSLHALTAAALILPGLLQPTAHAADDDIVDFQYSHFQEGKRAVYDAAGTKLPQGLNPIEVDSLHGGARVTLTDRIKFAFNYTQDTWSGATPLGTAPALAGGNNPQRIADPNTGQLKTFTGASPLLIPPGQFFADRQGNLYSVREDPLTALVEPGPKLNRLTHVLSYASPETRKQGDFKLSYAWDKAALEVGGGISVENDYESRFGNLGGRIDFNRKQTTLNWGVSYTNSDTHAALDPHAVPYFSTDSYETLNFSIDPDTGADESFYTPNPGTPAKIDSTFSKVNRLQAITRTLRGNRQDWGGQLGLNQVLGRDTLLNLDLGYSRSTGYLANPYKLVYRFTGFDTTEQKMASGQPIRFGGQAVMETRPDERNQFNWHIGLSRFIKTLDAALHLNYRFAYDDWGINTHTVEADWVQPVGRGWTLTPRIRYYSQTAADFYTPYLKVVQVTDDIGNPVDHPLNRPQPAHFSSDQRLSGFGTLSGGLTVAKQFAKGIGVEAGFEYYTHQGGLKLGGGGEGGFADFDYWVANAALKVNLESIGAPGNSLSRGGAQDHRHPSHAPAGIMFDHALAKAGDIMLGYRYMRSAQAGDMLLGSKSAGLDAVRLNACDAFPEDLKECRMYPQSMAMSMHMLDLMVAPTDWLTLMLMPQWLDMDMGMTPFDPDSFVAHGDHASHGHQVGGIGDTGMYALFKVFDQPNQHFTLSVGGTAPTGDSNVTLRETGSTRAGTLIHYGMQLGSGTWDFRPVLTYAGNTDTLLWGAQATGTLRLEGKNASGYRLGDLFQGSAWGGVQWTDWLATTVRGVYTWQDRLHGGYRPIFDGSGIEQPPLTDAPFDLPTNYGGQFVDLGLGINVTIPHGAFAGNSLKFEWLQPVHTDYNGYQLGRDYALTFTWSYGF